MKNLRIGAGNSCPKCRSEMSRYGHPPHWKPKVGQPYYFDYWDYCGPCRHVQLYECAKVQVGRKPETARVDQIKAQLTPAYAASGDRPPWEE